MQHLIACNLRTLAETFPQAKLIMTHRSLESVLPSLCSAQAMLIRGSQPRRFDAAQLGPVAVEMYQTALKALLEARAELEPERFIDVSYEDLTTEPLAVYRQLMTAMSLTVTTEDDAAVRQWIADNPRGRFPAHSYSLETYGLSREEIARAFAFFSPEARSSRDAPTAGRREF